MTSFINLFGNDRWSEADIVNRTEAMIASEYPPAAAAILNRKVSGAALGQYTLSAAEQADLAHYAQVSNDARAAGDAARADMVKLQAVLDYEQALAVIATPAPDVPATVLVMGENQVASMVANPVLTAHIEKIAAAQAVIDGASADALALYSLRNPMIDDQGVM
jgi:hypothetical protein